MEQALEKVVPATATGRFLIRFPEGPKRGLLVGFHGYAQNASELMTELEELPGVEKDWILCSVQALHLFYRRTTDEVVASWMTRLHREEAIRSNLLYVDSVIAKVRQDLVGTGRLVLAGFSQGASMAYRAAFLRPDGADGVIALGGDIPPEIDSLQSSRNPTVLIGRGQHDDWYTDRKMQRDVDKLDKLGIGVETMVFPGGHEWSPEFKNRCGDFLSRLL